MQQEPLDPSLVVSELMDPCPIDASVLTRQESNVIWNTVVVDLLIKHISKWPAETQETKDIAMVLQHARAINRIDVLV
ncbi:hypothetical protein FCV25MIE_18964, partial [Fagus crenata]